MFGILTVQQEPKCGIRRRLALRLFPKRSLQVEEGLFRTAMFMQVRLTVCPWWKGNLQEKRISLALRRLRERGIRINDLHSVMLDHRQDGICEDLIHLNDVGIELCAAQTAQVIKDALGEMA